MIHNNLTEEVVQDVTNNMNPYFGSQELRALLRSLNSVAGIASGGSEEVPWASITGVPAALTAAQAAGTPSIRAIGTSATTAAAGNHTHGAATTSAAGFMSAADKVKLDGIAAGATALTIGSAATNAAAGNHSHAISSLTGTATIAQLPTGTTATTVALGNHTHTASAITATAVGGGIATNVQGILVELAARIAALETA